MGLPGSRGGPEGEVMRRLPIVEKLASSRPSDAGRSSLIMVRKDMEPRFVDASSELLPVSQWLRLATREAPSE